jgi:hypothetical protein
MCGPTATHLAERQVRGIRGGVHGPGFLRRARLTQSPRNLADRSVVCPGRVGHHGGSFDIGGGREHSESCGAPVLDPRPFRSCRLRRHNPSARSRSGAVTSLPSSTRGPATVTKHSASRSRFEPGACRGRPGYPSRRTRARWLRSRLWSPSCWLAAGSACAARRAPSGTSFASAVRPWNQSRARGRGYG